MAKTAEELKELIGKQAGISDWLTIDQADCRNTAARMPPAHILRHGCRMICALIGASNDIESVRTAS